MHNLNEQFTVIAVKGGYVLITFDLDTGEELHEVFIAESKLLKRIKQLLETFDGAKEG